MASRILHRIRQFWNALFFPRRPVATETLSPHLTAAEIALFHRMHPSEQAHCLQVFNRLRTGGQTDPGLLSAALLHDVGKVMQPLSLVERVLIVLGLRLFPQRAKRWGLSPSGGGHRAFVTAAHHGEWGAVLAEKAGASPVTVDLIRRHQEPPGQGDALLQALQAADDET